MTKDFKKQSTADSAFGQYGLGWMVGGIAIGLLIGAGMYALANKGNVADTSTPPSADTTTVNTSSALTPPTAAPDTTAALAGNNGAASLQDSPAKTNEAVDETPGFSYHAVLPQLEIDVQLSAQVEQQMNATQPAPDKTAADKKKAPEKPETEKKTTTPEKALEKTPEETAEKSPEKASTTPEKTSPPAPASATPTGFNGFQIGSYKTQDQAANMQQRLQQNGLNSRIEAANVQGATWYRVKIGPASSAAMFHKWQQTLSGMGISPMAVRM